MQKFTTVLTFRPNGQISGLRGDAFDMLTKNIAGTRTMRRITDIQLCGSSQFTAFGEPGQRYYGEFLFGPLKGRHVGESLHPLVQGKAPTIQDFIAYGPNVDFAQVPAAHGGTVLCDAYQDAAALEVFYINWLAARGVDLMKRTKDD